MSNILVATIGLSSDVIIEDVGLINHTNVDLYANSPVFDEICRIRSEVFENRKVDELWLTSTDILTSVEMEKVRQWNIVDKVRYFILDGVGDITSQSEAEQFHDLVLRVVKYAHSQKGKDGKLWLALAGGRKTMSTDIQDAAYCFGCDEIFHILGERVSMSVGTPLSVEDAAKVKPAMLGSVAKNSALQSLSCPDFEYDDVLKCTPSTEFLDKVVQKKKESQFFYTSYYLNDNDRTNFPVLYTFNSEKIDTLKKTILGIDPSKKDVEMSILKCMPKTELHCHLGGVLDSEGLIRVAKTYKEHIEKERKKNPVFDKWCVETYAQCLSMSKPNNWKSYCEEVSKNTGVPPCIVNAYVILCFDQNMAVLDKFLFGNYTDEESYFKIDITAYEALGDMQGSMLLQTEKAITETMQILKEYAVRENIAYLEVRCSPLNYTKLGKNAKSVVSYICRGLEFLEEAGIVSSLIIIASRHSDHEKIRKNVELASEMQNDVLFAKYFRGFDVAGDESQGRPADLRQYFEDALKDCRNITIHAGETLAADSIWDAVYSLSAERVGHGLSLIENSNLMNKFLERRIGIEMCPSSNYQIVGFRDNYYLSTVSEKEYPLRSYLSSNLMVCVNTDNPGISRTTATNELHRAARLTRNGLSLWDMFQLVYNGLLLSFLPYNDKKSLIRNVEKRISDLLKEGKI